MPSTTIVAVCLVLLALTAAGAQSDGWLNAREFGASGSDFHTTATVTAGEKQITVADPGDFAVGQGIMLSKCHPRIEAARMWGPGTTYAKLSGKPPKDIIDLRGYDETSGGWTVYVLDVEPVEPFHFRWSDDMGRTWRDKTAITYDWQPLQGGLEVRFHQFPWQEGYSCTFAAREQLLSTITAIDGKTITVADAPTKSSTAAVLRHRDDAALQEAVNQALKQRRNLFVPAGHYCLAQGLSVSEPAGLIIAGVDGENSVLDISEGNGCIVMMRGGTECTVRDFKMIGNMGFAERDQCGHFRTLGSRGIWGQDLKTSFATGVRATERVLVENVHAYRMSLEAFWSGGPARDGAKEPARYTKAIDYLRCWAIDCGRNGFNNNDLAENTSIQYCRIVDVGGCAWEGASRFVKIVGNYIRNAGTVAIGNIRNRRPELEILGSGQHIVADNVFESVVPYGGCAIRSASGATQVTIANNLFVNFGSSAIEIWGMGDSRGLPSANTIITGNLFDLTEIGPTSKPRHAVDLFGAADTTISDNQFVVRGAPDPQVTGIRLREPALNVVVHDNLLRNLGVGLEAVTGQARVGEVSDERTFTSAGGHVPLERRRSHRYRDYKLVWTSAGKLQGPVRIEDFDPDSQQFRLAEPAKLKVGDMFEVCPPSANWSVHDNTLTGCLRPVVLTAWGSPTSVVRANLIDRGGAPGVRQALLLAGAFAVVDNRFHGFDEDGAAALALAPDRLGAAGGRTVRGNLFQACATAVAETAPGLWPADATAANTYVDCRATVAAAP